MSKNNIHDMKIAAAYIRVSTDKQEELSPDAQKRLLIEYSKKNHIILPEEYIFLENGISGRKADKRPEFQKMIGLAKSKEHPIDVILVWKFSRFARNQEESIVYKSLLKKNNVDVISVSEPIIDGPFGTLIERILEWMDEYYSIQLAGEVYRGMYEKALRGGYQASPPLGYKIVTYGEPPIIVPEEAVIIRKIYDLYVNDNMSIYKICNYLNEMGFKTRRGGKFEKRSIEYILQNPTYIGKIRWNRTENETNRIKDKSEWIINRGLHDAIITEEIFEAANTKFNETYRPRGSRPSSSQKHWLSGILKCSACGRTLVASSRFYPEKGENGISYWNFQCYGYNKAKCTQSNHVSALKVIPVVLDEIQKFMASDNYYFEIKETIESDDTKNLINAQLDKLKLKESRIKAAYAAGIDTLEEYKQNKIALNNERDQLMNQLETLSPTKRDIEEIRREMKSRAQYVYDIITDENVEFDLKGDAIKSIIDKIIVDKPNNTLNMFFYFN